LSALVGALVAFCTHVVSTFGIAGVFGLMALEGACVPVPSEAIMLFAGFSVSQGHMAFGAAVAAAVAGNLLGSWAAYAIGYYGGRPFIDRWGRYVLLSRHKVDLAHRWFVRYGAAAVFFSRMLPLVRTFISLPAGVARMTFWRFTLYTVLGCLPWVVMLTYLGMKVADNWEKIQRQLHYLDYMVVLAVAGVIVWLVARRWRAAAAEG
jgi:membrane protein DedA with SNARE-associated domain